ncbi:hypothetical protein [Methanobacterium lacus]|uniref:hypothetical protein n=1 Tax=Methanobacterium lacus (strain AL-21) TaxID=877455 RepID=UPI00064E73B2|nr:hypothetical protein [Methanobacterium lacus]
MRKQQSDADGAQYVIYQKPTDNNNSRWIKYMFYQQKNPETNKFEYKLVGIANVTLMNKQSTFSKFRSNK